MSGDAEPTDVAVIGGGPAGLFATFYAGLRGLRVALFEALPFVGGQVAALYPEKRIFDVGGFPAIRGAELVARLEEQAARAQPAWHLGEAVVGLERRGRGFVLRTAHGGCHPARAVVLTVGIGRFRPRALGVQGVDQWLGRGLSHTLRDARGLAGRPVLVVGGGDSALDWALELAEAGARVSVVHRRAQFRAVEAAVARALALGVQLRTVSVVDAVLGDSAGPHLALVRHLETGEISEVPCSQVVLALGFEADLSFLEPWGIPLEGRGIVVSPDSMRVDAGIYAAGDAVVYRGKLKLIATAFAEAALAVSACKQSLEPGARLQAGHSSDLATPR
jgi:thioredoxin reductase (NADPH)